MFQDRQDAARKLAQKLKTKALHNPLVLAIPRGGMLTGAVLAQELDSDLDIVLSRKLRAPGQPEFALGAISEDGQVYLNPSVAGRSGPPDAYLARERRHQLAEISRRKKLFRAARPAVPVTGRSVIVTDDGIATGSTMIAALQILRAQKPRELIVAVPVAAPDRLEEVRRWCDEVICLQSPRTFWAIGQFYADFRQVEDSEVVKLLRSFATRSQAQPDSARPFRQKDQAVGNA